MSLATGARPQIAGAPNKFAINEANPFIDISYEQASSNLYSGG
jgi:hypothetical protein